MSMQLKDIKIGSKLAGGFGILLTIMVILIAVAIVNLGAIHGDLNRIVTVNNMRTAEELASQTEQLTQTVSFFKVGRELKKISQHAASGTAQPDRQTRIESREHNEGKGRETAA